MTKTLGYMVTWTTYGTWLQGDGRGWVKDGSVRSGNEILNRKNFEDMKQDAVWLSGDERVIVKNAILDEVRSIGLTVLAITVQNGHVHVVLNRDGQEFARVAGKLKRAATIVLREAGFVGKVWTKEYDVQYCFDAEGLQARIDYVERHKR
ncbi:MAG: hypothetical protein KAS23_16915 [Anaerohalosphaera sp.]|nr:hypothetical protein [Anaerohalosphaera sp.]